jgi:hypothetical protein
VPEKQANIHITWLTKQFTKGFLFSQMWLLALKQCLELTRSPKKATKQPKHDLNADSQKLKTNPCDKHPAMPNR